MKTPEVFVLADPTDNPVFEKILTVTPNAGAPVAALVTVPVIPEPDGSAKSTPDVVNGADTAIAVPFKTEQLLATQVIALNS